MRKLMLTKNSKYSLPSLIFGGRTAKIDDSIYDTRERLRFVVPGLQDIEATSNDPCLHSSSLLNINGLKLAASASSPNRFKVGINENTTLLIPFAGQGTVTIDGKLLNWEMGQKALVLPNSPFNGESIRNSTLIIEVDPKRLESIICNMLNLSAGTHLGFDSTTPREVDMQIGRLSFETMFRQFGNQLDQLSLQPELLNRSGIDDVIYRSIAMMLYPKLFLDAAKNPVNNFERRLLDRVCQHIQANLDQPITISTLEQIGCMSKRKLHYAFQQRYNMTPMQWVRTERLLRSHSLLISAIPGVTISSVALACGFSKSTTFTQYYSKEFGEHPATTLKRVLSR